MLLYRIIFAKYAESKFASGDSGRWNLDGQRVLYTSSSLALAMPEIMAHKLRQGVDNMFKIPACQYISFAYGTVIGLSVAYSIGISVFV